MGKKEVTELFMFGFCIAMIAVFSPLTGLTGNDLLNFNPGGGQTASFSSGTPASGGNFFSQQKPSSGLGTTIYKFLEEVL